MHGLQYGPIEWLHSVQTCRRFSPSPAQRACKTRLLLRFQNPLRLCSSKARREKMPWHTFPYHEFHVPPSPPFPNGVTAHRPILVVQLTGSNQNKFRCIVCPDSGADRCLFPLSFALAMKLDPLQLKSNLTGGVGNTGNTTVYDLIEVEIQEVAPDRTGGFSLRSVASFPAYAGFTSGLEAQGIGLLGQADFFERFVVTFDHKARQFQIDVP